MAEHGCFRVREGDAAAPPSVRAKLARAGVARLDERELLALLLGTGVRGRSALELAGDLLARAGGLGALATRCAREGPPMTRGAGPVAAARLVAAFEIARRLAPTAGARRPLRDPDEVAREVRDIAAEPREHLVGLYLDARAALIARETVAVGSVNVARASPRDLLEPALRHLASGFVMVHNHPSGNPEPSDDDVLFTRSVGRAAHLVGVPLWDHVVVVPGAHASLRARGVRWDGLEGDTP